MSTIITQFRDPIFLYLFISYLLVLGIVLAIFYIVINVIYEILLNMQSKKRKVIRGKALG